nr:transcription factor MYB101-like [Tanacetum cinerariifolium]GEZ24885.1 transcription factor MYB101-like [Tanacetum cinerariifolium]
MVQEYVIISNAGIRKGSGGGRKPRVTNGLNKGLWTPEEDATLIKYVQENGERFWNDIWRSHGLMRCGKSCRRRWMNNLKSSLKKEDFTPEEENKILRLHAQHGNRWSLLTLHFSGRTDNEIKNYWNVRHKRLTRAGLPIYPPEIQKEIDLRDIHLQQKEDIENQLQISPSSSSQNKTNHDSASITPLLSIEAAKNYNDKFIATSSSNSHQARTSISFSSSSSLDENSNFSLIDPMKYPLMYASLYHPSKMLLGDSNGKGIMALLNNGEQRL